MLFQRIYVSILNWIYKNTFLNKINNKLRNKLLFISCLALSYYYLVRAASDFGTIEYKRVVLGVLTVLLILLSINQEIKEVSLNIYSYLFFIVGLGILGFSLFYLDSYKFVFLGFSMTVLFPCLYLIWNTRKDWDTLFIYFSLTSIIIALFYYLFFYKYALDGVLFSNIGRLRATAMHQNDFSFIYVSSLVSSAYLIYLKRDNIPFLIFLCASFSLSIVNIMMSKCRASFLAIIAIIASYLIFRIKTIINKSNKNNIKKSVMIILSICLFIPVFSYLNNELKEISINSYVEKYGDIEVMDDADSVLERMALNNSGNTLYDKLNNISTGRFYIWINYLKNSTLLGNPYDGLQDEIGYYAHNVIVDITHRYGFIEGGLFAIWLICCVIQSIIILFKKKYTDEKYLYLVLITFSYFIISMLDTVSAIDGFYLPYCFYVAVGLFCFKN